MKVVYKRWDMSIPEIITALNDNKAQIKTATGKQLDELFKQRDNLVCVLADYFRKDIEKHWKRGEE